MKQFLTYLLWFGLTIPTAVGQNFTKTIKGVQHEVSFINSGIDFSKTFVILTDNYGNDLTSWENAFSLSNLEVGSYYVDTETNTNVCSGDYAVTIERHVSGMWQQGTLLFTDLDDNEVVGRIIITSTSMFFVRPNHKQSMSQVEIIKTFVNNSEKITKKVGKASASNVFPSKWFGIDWYSKPSDVLDEYEGSELKLFKNDFSQVTLYDMVFNEKPATIDYTYNESRLSGGTIWFNYDNSHLLDSAHFYPVMDHFFDLYQYFTDELGEASEDFTYSQEPDWERIEYEVRRGNLNLSLNWETDQGLIYLDFSVETIDGDKKIFLSEMFLK